MAVMLTDIQFAFAIGAFFADAGAPVIQAARDHSEASLCKVYCRYLLRSLAYAAFFLGPVATIFVLAYPAWESQYTIPIFDHLAANPANAGVWGLFLSLMFAAGWFGNWLGFKWVLAGARRRLRTLYLLVVAITFAVFFARSPAPTRVGSYAAFHGDPTALPTWIQDRTFLTGFLVLLVPSGLPVLVGFIRIRQSVQALRAGSQAPILQSPVPMMANARRS